MKDIIGTLAAMLTTAAFVPQVLHTWRTRRADDVSLGMYVVFTLGLALWTAYGFLISSWPVILANAATLVLALAILGMKLRWSGAAALPAPSLADRRQDATPASAPPGKDVAARDEH
ncbi:MAG: hypothetical protein JWP36_668 [Paucimonas sp.]|nr:hypothetical protein [Paucimonas sp.]